MSLHISDLGVSYGASVAVHEMSLTVEPNQVVSVIGPNGAGKSSLLRGVMGLGPSTGGIELDGVPIQAMSTPARCRAGLSFVPDGPGVFFEMTVKEHIRVAGGRDWKARWESLVERFPLLAEKQHTAAGDLSGGQKQTVSIARALASEPRYILLDEPSMGLSPIAIRGVIDAISELSTTGVGVLIVEQNSSLALSVSDEVHVVVRGSLVHSGTPASLRAAGNLAELYLGRAETTPGGSDDHR